MSADFSAILQTYLYYKNQNHRVGSGLVPEAWPTDFPPLQTAWATDVALLKLRAEDAGEEFEDLSESVGCVGYSVKECKFWIPAPLCAFLPASEIMAKLFEAAEERKLFSKSSICISGSSVLMGVVPRVGDLDLFEYVDENAVRHELLEKAPKYREGHVLCRRVMVGNTKNGLWPLKENRWEHSEEQIFPDKMRTYAAKYLDQYDFCKIDMIGAFAGNHIGDISNIVFRHQDKFDFATETFPSFPFQEVVTGSKRPSRERYSLKNFGDYVFWLAAEVEAKILELNGFAGRPTLQHMAKKIAIKGAKRAMLLAAMIGDNDKAKWFSDILGHKVSREYALMTAIGCFVPMIQAGGNAKKLLTPALELAQAELKSMDEIEDEDLDLHELLSQLSSLVDCFDNLCYPSRLIDM